MKKKHQTKANLAKRTYKYCNTCGISHPTAAVHNCVNAEIITNPQKMYDTYSGYQCSIYDAEFDSYRNCVEHSLIHDIIVNNEVIEDEILDDSDEIKKKTNNSKPVRNPRKKQQSKKSVELKEKKHIDLCENKKFTVEGQENIIENAQPFINSTLKKKQENKHLKRSFFVGPFLLIKHDQKLEILLLKINGHLSTNYADDSALNKYVHVVIDNTLFEFIEQLSVDDKIKKILRPLSVVNVLANGSSDGPVKIDTKIQKKSEFNLYLEDK